LKNKGEINQYLWNSEAEMRRGLFCYGLRIVTVIAFAIALYAVNIAQESNQNRSWDHSVTNSITLNIEGVNQGGRAGMATIIVATPDGGYYYSYRRYNGVDVRITERFPDSFRFTTPPESGTYSWICIVNGEVVASGRFEYVRRDISSDQSLAVEEIQRIRADAGVESISRDARIAESINIQIDQTEELRNSSVSVRVEQTVVTLSGTVENMAQKARVEAIARSIEGVISVRNELIISPPR
jgi:hypothetical protein